MKLKFLLLAISMLMCIFLVSCAKDELAEEWEPPKNVEQTQTAEENGGESEPVKKDGIKSIDFILMGYTDLGPPRNKKLIESVLHELNGHLADEIGAEVSVDWAPYKTYAESVMEMIAAAGGIDAVDIMYPGSDVFAALTENDMLADIKDEFRMYMPETYKFLYDKYAYLDDYLLTGGVQYVIPKIDAYPHRSYIITVKDIYDEYAKEITTLEDYEDYMQWISENKPDKWAGYANPIDVIDTYLLGNGYCMYSATSFYSPMTSYSEMVPMERVPEFRDAYEMLVRWDEKGYRGNVREGGQYRAANTGKLVSMLVDPMYQHTNEQAISLSTDIEYKYIVLYKDTRTLSSPSFTGPGILNGADAATETLMFYELIYTRQDLYDIVQYGVEGENYSKEGEKLTLPDDSNKVIRGWYGSGNFYNYSMERPLWSEPDDYTQFFEEISFYNTVTSKELSIEQGNELKASDIDEDTMEEIERLYDEGLSPLMDERFSVYGKFVEKLERGDFSMSTDEAISMLDEGNAQEIVDTYEAIRKLYDSAE